MTSRLTLVCLLCSTYNMTHSTAQTSIKVVVARAGTSRGLFLHEDDLPAAGPARDRLLVRLLGSPDALQIDGLGGARPITSKIAIVGLSDRDDADVDYTFAQVDPASGGIGYEGNCGNISAGVGPFAVDERLVAVQDGVTVVRIYNTNTDTVLVAEVPVVDGLAAVEGDYVIPGVPGTGAEIPMNWRASVGSRTGRLLPTGNAVDTLVMADGQVVTASLVDAGNPCVWVRATDFGLDGSEGAVRINGDASLLSRVSEARRRAAVLFGFAQDWELADQQSPGLPMLGLVSPPTDYTTINGVPVRAAEMDLRLHLIFLGSLHESVAGTGSICFAAASRTPGTVVAELTRDPGKDVLLVGHASGVTPTRVRTHALDQAPFVAFDDLGFSRTARRIMEGQAFYPAALVA